MTSPIDLSREHRTAIDTIRKLSEIVKYHNLHMVGGGYKDVIDQADAIVNLTDDLKIFLRHEVIKELKANMRPINSSCAVTPFEKAHGYFISNTIPAIRLYRAWTGLGLVDAKAAVDRIKEDISFLRIDVLPVTK